MNNKGQLGIALMLIVGVIGLIIINDIGSTMTTATSVVNETITGLVTNGTTDSLANGCPVTVATFYDTTNSTAVDASNYTLAPATAPSRITTYTVTWAAANFLHNGTNITADYTHNCNYADNSILRLIIDNIPILFAVGLLVLAVGWAALR